MPIKGQPIPWPRILAEGAAIVVSILLAFAIDAAWQHRGEVAEEREILVGLEAEYVDLRDRLEFWAQMNRQGMSLIERYLSGEARSMSRGELEELFVHSMLANVLDQGGPLDALLASGRLERIEDRAIRVRLAKWPDWLEDIHTNDLSARDFAFREIAPFLAERGIPRVLCPEGEWACAPDDTIPRDYVELSENPQFRALLLFRRGLMWMAAADHEQATVEANELLAMISDRLDALGG